MGDFMDYSQPKRGASLQCGKLVECFAFFSSFAIVLAGSLIAVGSEGFWAYFGLPVALGLAVVTCMRFRLVAVVGLLLIECALLALFYWGNLGGFSAGRFPEPELFALGLLLVFTTVSFLVSVIIGYNLQTVHYRQNMLQKIFEALPIGILVRSRMGEDIFVNGEWERFLPGVRVDSGSQAEGFMRKWEDVLAEIDSSSAGQIRSQSVQLNGSAGKVLDLTLMAMPIHIDQYDEQGTLSLLIDETVLRSYQDKVRETERSLQLALDNAEMGFWDYDVASGKVIYDTNSMRILNLTEAELGEGFEGWKARIHQEDKHRFEEAYSAYLRSSSGSLGMDYRILTGTGSYIWIQDYMSVVRSNADGSAQRIIGTMQEITQRKKIELDLKLQKERAEAANDAKSHFLATISHEIRTPLNAIIGLSSFLAESEMTEDQNDLLNTIRFSGKSLLTLVNDILDFSKIEAGRIELEVQEYPLHLCLEECIKLFNTSTQDIPIELSLHVDCNLPEYVLGDMERLRQIVQNLLSNAFKFTEKGTVQVRVNRIKLDDLPAERQPDPWAKIGYLDDFEREYLQFTIEDSGIGIAEDRKHLLFKAFSQVDASASRKYGGTGLGLAICKRLVQSMGGKIWCESCHDAGATFGFVVRTQLIPELSSSASTVEGQRSKRSEVVEKISLQYPCSILIFGDGDEAKGLLDACRQLGYSPHHVASYDFDADALHLWRYNIILISVQAEEPTFALARKLHDSLDLGGETSIIGCLPQDKVFDEDRSKLFGLSLLVREMDQPQTMKATILNAISEID